MVVIVYVVVVVYVLVVHVVVVAVVVVVVVVVVFEHRCRPCRVLHQILAKKLKQMRVVQMKLKQMILNRKDHKEMSQ